MAFLSNVWRLTGHGRSFTYRTVKQMNSVVRNVSHHRNVPSNHANTCGCTYRQSRTFATNPDERTTNGYDEDSGDTKTHFGFKTVTEKEKYEKVYQVFHNVADQYDVMNDAMSVGVHRLWKDYFIEHLSPSPGTRLIDVAGGTGDIAFRFLRYLENENDESLKNTDWTLDIPLETESIVTEDNVERPGVSHVTVCDINQAMLDVGKKRAAEAGYTKGISWLRGNAECLPVPDNSYHAYTIAFGIRNTTHIDKVLAEAYRVLKPGGRFMCLEFSRVKNMLFRRIYDEYSFQVIPVLGKIIAGDWHSYQYLVESIRKFPDQEEFAAMIRDANFRAVSYTDVMGGIAAIHSGFKLSEN